jgi:hypothetical protein
MSNGGIMIMLRKGLVVSVLSAVVIFAGCAYSGDVTGGAITQEQGKANADHGAVPNSADAFIEKLANNAGEYFDPGEAYRAHLEPVDLMMDDDVPGRIKSAADELVSERRATIEMEDPQSEGHTVEVIYRDARIADDCYVINDELGYPIGYIISIEDLIDHPLFDGAGVRYYVNQSAEAIADVEWTG